MESQVLSPIYDMDIYMATFFEGSARLGSGLVSRVGPNKRLARPTLNPSPTNMGGDLSGTWDPMWASPNDPLLGCHTGGSSQPPASSAGVPPPKKAGRPSNMEGISSHPTPNGWMLSSHPASNHQVLDGSLCHPCRMGDPLSGGGTGRAACSSRCNHAI